ncbi:Uncharacterised protein [Streptococcus cristatus]|uniref:Uncharacterized protein n=2 Tax=Streptococcus cristatus TaxID=45634 RepID=A0A512AAF7_STRCR|nr:hypothetical protein [Streptococcus cristatus]AGK70626.1 hypothetical protein I872_02590 [Streptococcus cristatus AS 1.3089]GEN96673.1 hypothetical protein SOL01_05470 [Streptococcus cristatus]SQI46478.1 Uncharacterised protein [Streptococcus cristatus]
MRRSSKKKRDLHSFREIKRDLYRQQKLKREELSTMTMQEERKRLALAYLLLCLAISFALFFGFYYLSQKVPNKAELKYKYDDKSSSVSGDSSASQQGDDESKLTQEQKELKKKIVEEDEEKFAFNWTLDNFVELKVENGGTNSPTLEEVIAKYGKGSAVSFGTKGLTLTYKTRIIDVPRYGSSGHPQEIRLSFYDPDSNGKTYYLINKSAVYLDDSRYPSATKDEFVFKWKQEDMDTLKIGDSQHGKGGMTYQEVVERFGLPSELNIYGSGMSNSPLSLQANYRNFRNIERKYDSVTLTFKRQEDGSFYLANANSEFDKSW